MSRVITLADFRPSPRADEKPWMEARIEEADELEPASPPAEEPFEVVWTEVATLALAPVDDDAAKPRLRDLTVDGIEGEWLRVIFLDEDGNEDAPSGPFAVDGPDFRPLVKDVAGILNARTRESAPEGDLTTITGNLAETFTNTTTPSRAKVLELIDVAAAEVAGDVALVMPPQLVGLARRVTALRAAAEIERSFIPEQSEENASIYQTLRLTFEDERARLQRSVQWFSLARRLERKQIEEADNGSG